MYSIISLSTTDVIVGSATSSEVISCLSSSISFKNMLFSIILMSTLKGSPSADIRVSLFFGTPASFAYQEVFMVFY